MSDIEHSEIQTITFREGVWHHSEFPHPLVTLDFDANGKLLAVSAPGAISSGAVERAEKAEARVHELEAEVARRRSENEWLHGIVAATRGR